MYRVLTLQEARCLLLAEHDAGYEIPAEYLNNSSYCAEGSDHGSHLAHGRGGGDHRDTQSGEEATDDSTNEPRKGLARRGSLSYSYDDESSLTFEQWDKFRKVKVEAITAFLAPKLKDSSLYLQEAFRDAKTRTVVGSYIGKDWADIDVDRVMRASPGEELSPELEAYLKDCAELLASILEIYERDFVTLYHGRIGSLFDDPHPREARFLFAGITLAILYEQIPEKSDPLARLTHEILILIASIETWLEAFACLHPVVHIMQHQAAWTSATSPGYSYELDPDDFPATEGHVQAEMQEAEKRLRLEKIRKEEQEARFGDHEGMPPVEDDTIASAMRAGGLETHFVASSACQSASLSRRTSGNGIKRLSDSWTADQALVNDLERSNSTASLCNLGRQRTEDVDITDTVHTQLQRQDRLLGSEDSIGTASHRSSITTHQCSNCEEEVLMPNTISPFLYKCASCGQISFIYYVNEVEGAKSEAVVSQRKSASEVPSSLQM